MKNENKNNVRKVAEVVKVILTKYPKARDNDNYLICCVISCYGENFNDSFMNIMKKISDGILPSLESITRARRKVQELYPDLRGEDKVQDARLEKTAEYMRFAQDDKV